MIFSKGSIPSILGNCFERTMSMMSHSQKNSETPEGWATFKQMKLNMKPKRNHNEKNNTASKNTRWKIIYQNEMAFMFCVSKSNQISWCIFHNLFSGDLLGWRLWHFTVGNASSKTTLLWASYPVEDVSNWLTVNMKRIWFFLFKITPSFLSV